MGGMMGGITQAVQAGADVRKAREAPQPDAQGTGKGATTMGGLSSAANSMVEPDAERSKYQMKLGELNADPGQTSLAGKQLGFGDTLSQSIDRSLQEKEQSNLQAALEEAMRKKAMAGG